MSVACLQNVMRNLLFSVITTVIVVIVASGEKVRYGKVRYRKKRLFQEKDVEFQGITLKAKHGDLE